MRTSMPQVFRKLCFRSIRYSSNIPVTTKPITTTPEAPEYQEIDFQKFKFDSERTNQMLGYTMEELYGKKYGIRHSPAIEKEIRKDTYFFGICAVLAFFYFNYVRRQKLNNSDAWNNYVYHDMNTIRPINPHN